MWGRMWVRAVWLPASLGEAFREAPGGEVEEGPSCGKDGPHKGQGSRDTEGPAGSWLRAERQAAKQVPELC